MKTRSVTGTLKVFERLVWPTAMPASTLQRQKTGITLRHMKTDEIAAAMGTTNKTVLNQELKAIKLLREVLKGEERCLQ